MVLKIIKGILHKSAPRWLVLLIDLYVVLNTFLFAYLIRFNFHLNFDLVEVWKQLPIVFLVGLCSFLITGSYRGIVRHTGLTDVFKVLIASCSIAFVLVSLVWLNRVYNISNTLAIPFSIIAIHFLLNIFILIALRYVFKELYTTLFNHRKYDKNVIIYGAGEAGLITQSILSRDTASKVKIIGFIDDDLGKGGKYINGLKVYGPTEITAHFIQKKSIEDIIISIQRIKADRISEIVNYFSLIQVNVKIIPPVGDWLNNNLKINQIRKVKITDLLGRKAIKLNNPILKEELFNKVVMVTGAAGSIGSEISKQLADYQVKKIIIIDQAESPLYELQQYFIRKKRTNIISIVGNVKDAKRMDVIFETYRPDIVYHAAAYKHVPFMEENAYEAVKINVGGSKNIVDLSMEYKVDKFVFISTDKAVNPTNIMGATKRISELYINCQKNKCDTKFIITRFGNVLGSSGSVIPLFKNQIKNGGPLTVTHKEITRYFMTISEACQLVLEAGSMGKGGEIFVFDMGKPVKIIDLAKSMIKLSGLNYPEDIKIEITGLRPGEKIQEELLAQNENTLPTHNEKILIAKDSKINILFTEKNINILLQNNHEMYFDFAVEQMKLLVPEFISNNSKYEELDKVKDEYKNY